MRKLLSEVVGMPIFDETDPERPISMVRDLVVSPSDGSIVAFHCMGKKVVVPRDIVLFNNAVFVRSADDLVGYDEVVRVQEVMREVPSLVGLSVFVETTKNFIGRVTDFEFDVPTCTLTSLYTAKLLLLFRYNERIISRKNIIRISREGIFVKNTALAKVKSPIKVLEEVEMATPSPA